MYAAGLPEWPTPTPTPLAIPPGAEAILARPHLRGRPRSGNPGTGSAPPPPATSMVGPFSSRQPACVVVAAAALLVSDVYKASASLSCKNSTSMAGTGTNKGSWYPDPGNQYISISSADECKNVLAAIMALAHDTQFFGCVERSPTGFAVQCRTGKGWRDGSAKEPCSTCFNDIRTDCQTAIKEVNTNMNKALAELTAMDTNSDTKPPVFVLIYEQMQCNGCGMSTFGVNWAGSGVTNASTAKPQCENMVVHLNKLLAYLGLTTTTTISTTITRFMLHSRRPNMDENLIEGLGPAYNYVAAGTKAYQRLATLQHQQGFATPKGTLTGRVCDSMFHARATHTLCAHDVGRWILNWRGSFHYE